ncbi:major facilitator superfamily domain-containing protein [Thelonectria olida]|uniref:Major facilitator superfamily domain-containing protein n=1 Tax=Thelonectria olida TaxID=1576542 RepID=A0A9P8VTC1_9HYPO|nr:major facilitator superfamily domain-containing protein [Thelonectria olida]
MSPSPSAAGSEKTVEPDNLPTGNRATTYWRELTDHSFVTPDVLTWEYPGSGTEDDPYAVTWIPSDSHNPQRFSPLRKAVITGLGAIITLGAAFTSSTYAGCVPQVMQDLGAGEELATAGISLYVLGFAVGPLIWAPAGEIYGRQVILFITYGAFTAFNAGSTGSKSIATLLVLRFLAGSFSASSMTNTGGVIADMYVASERGIPVGMFALAPFMGPVFGPIVGGYLGESDGWRWVSGFTAIFSGVLWLLAAVIIPETYTPLLLRKRARKLSGMTGKVHMSAIDIKMGSAMSSREQLKKGLLRPWSLIVSEPSLLFLSIYMSLLYGILYMLFGAMPIVFQEGRGWSEGKGGLAFLGVAIGEVVACLYCIPENQRYLRRAMKSGGSAEPEDRLVPAMIGAVATPIGLFWFAWTNGPSVHPLVSIAAGAPFGFGMVLVFISVKNYLVDSYTVFAASAIAATVVMRSLFGAAFPLFTTYMYHGLGIHWASSVAAFLSLACTPLPFVLYKYGRGIRQKCKYSRQAMELAAITDQQKSSG